MKTRSSHLALLFLWFAGAISVVVGRQVEFLKEILMGRCYYNPPTGIVGSCATVVDYLVGGLEGNKDKDITTFTFSRYFEEADFGPGAPGNEGLFWLKGSDQESSSVLLLPKGWTTPETTPGGAIMDGLNFCGVDLQQDCPDISQASNVFWVSAYKEYARGVEGKVHIVLEDGAHLLPLLEGGIPNLPADASVTLYASDCGSKDVQTVKKAFGGVINQESTSKTLREIACTENVAALVFCQDSASTVCKCLVSSLGHDETHIANQVGDTTSPSTMITNASYTLYPENKGGRTHMAPFWIFLLLFFLGLYVLCSQNKEMRGYHSLPAHNNIRVQ